MQQITLTSSGGRRSLAQLDAGVPEPGPGEVRLAVQAAGVCGSDVGAWQGKNAYDFLDTPRVLGHEYVGVVDALGTNVDTVDADDRVVERPLHACGVCTACRNGVEHVCERLAITGFHFDGAFAPYHIAPVDALHPIPAGIPDRRAAVTEPMAVAARATLDRISVRASDAVLVLGAGPMGSYSALIA
ncbi:MAG: zinc-binding dehydrogenase, partial [Halanaeroarchaeum sp.]